ncbi:diguanylate cyclase domain-containing protein [Marinobacter changyiensis]|uniref:diguanylate cyclase domain-containing protein n=1 Tax=Marinobacter changyiensis TaxID=2604091 RepID=UPI0012648EB5|nr:diguanylate cyclase [Marinobacter changyiensis]
MKRHPSLVIILLALIGLGLSAALSRGLYLEENQVIISEFRADVTQLASAFEREVVLNLEILFAVKNAAAILPEMNADLFDRLTARVLERAPAIGAFAWAPVVPQENRNEFVQQQQSWYPGFALSGVYDEVATTPVEHVPWLVPVQFIQPIAANRQAVGFDLASEKKRRAALLRARDTGQMIATAAIELVQDQTEEKGLLVFTPLYRGDSATTPEDRVARHQGFLNGVFRVEELVNQSINVAIDRNILIQIVDRTEGGEDVIYSTGRSSDSHWLRKLAYEVPLDPVAGRHWVVQAMPSEAFVSARRGYLPALVIGFGFSFIALLVFFAVRSLRQNAQLNAAKRELETISLTDALTGLANRRHFDLYLEQEWARARRQRQTIAMVMLDIDNFKAFNDEYGHPAGDQCLREVARALERVVRRPTDLVARYGGEEFALILPNTQDALAVAEACRLVIQRLGIVNEFSDVAPLITISAGVCSLVPTPEMPPDLLIQQADEALYEAKETGRNKVVSAVPTLQED